MTSTHSASNARNGLPDLEPFEPETPNYENLFNFLESARRWWRPVILITFAMMLIAALFTKFVAIHWYRATAVLRPVSQHESPAINSLVGGVGQIASMLGATGGESDMKAEEFIATLQSYDFAVPVIRQNDLQDHLDNSRGYLARLIQPHLTTWELYKLMIGRLDTQYSANTGNLTLAYEDNDSRTAVRILDLFITALREKVQHRELETARAAATSLLEEADHSADALLRGQIYLMAADQIKQEKLAQINADFAFFVIQSPIAPDRPTRPSVVITVILTGVLTFVLLCLGIAAMERYRLIRVQYRASQTDALALIPEGAPPIRSSSVRE